MQTILGAGGPVGISLAQALPSYTSEIRLVSRSPEPVNPGDELQAADLTQPEQVIQAVEGSEIAYLTAGLPYNTRYWREYWPRIMRNVIAACETHGSKLVFFDNVYMYDPKEIPFMTEQAKRNPSSQKGKVRLEVLNLLLDAMEKGKVEGTIARAADFYGPGKSNSVLIETVFKMLARGKPANWFSSTRFVHSFTYTPDAGKATALLGNAPEAYGEEWHLPTASDPPTGAEWIEMIAGEMGVSPKTQVAPKWLLYLLGLGRRELWEIPEMIYQYNQDYVFVSEKFEKRFSFSPMPYREGVKEILRLGFD